MPLFSALIAGLLLVAMPAVTPASAQEWTLDLYSGFQTARDATVSGRDELGTGFEIEAGWDSDPFELPPYWGLRAMRERHVDSDWSFGLEFSRNDVTADSQTLADSGFDELVVGDALTIVTANAQRRVILNQNWSAHAGLGLGVSLPSLDVTTPDGTETSGRQFGGPAARWYLGARYALGDGWSAFAEYSGTYSMNSADLEGGGALDADIVTNAVNLGLGLSF